MDRSPRALSKATLWPHIGGPLLALVVSLAIELSSRGPFRIPNPPAVLLFTVVLSAFIGGLGSGLVAAFLAWSYIAYFFSVPGHPLQYTAEDLRRVIVWALAIPGMTVMVGILKQRSERALRMSTEHAARAERMTEQMRMEHALQRSEARHAAILTAALDCVITMDHRGRILEFNRSAEATFGVRRDDVLGRELAEVMIPPDVRARHREGLARYLASGESPILNRRVEVDAVRASGETFPAELTVIRDPSSEPAIFTGFLRDITERRRAEENLRRLAAIVEDSDDAIFAKGLDGTMLTWNAGAERIYGYQAQEIVGRPVTVLVPAERQQEIPDILERVGRGERITHFETVRLRKGGTPIDVSLAISPLKGAAGRIIGASVIGRDITDSKRVEREIRALNAELENRVRQRTFELEATNKELEAFAYTVAHDLRSPIITLSGFSEMLIEDHRAALPEDAQRLILQIAESARHMNTLIGELLSFSRLVRQPLKQQPIAPADVVRQALAELDGAQNGRQVAVHLSDLPPCQADPSLLKQVFINLLSNALKFTRDRKDAAVEVGWRRDLDDPAHHTYFVADNGVGFDMRYANKLFGVFQRLHRKEEYEGTGVGLAIVQRVIVRHGGRVWAEGAPGKGATFYFTLPRSDAT